MENLIWILNIVLAVVLVILILFQKSEGGALGIGASQESLISSRAAGNFLTKTTAIIATLFILTSITLTVMSQQKNPTSSVLEKIEEKEDTSEPQIPKSE